MRTKVLIVFIMLNYMAVGQVKDTALYAFKQKMELNPTDTATINSLFKKLRKVDQHISTDVKVLHCSLIYKRAHYKTNKEAKAYACTEMGAYNNNVGDFDKALSYLFEAEKIYQSIGSPEQLGSIYNLIGNTYLALKNTKQQKLYYKKTYDLGLKYQLPEMEAGAAVGLANSASNPAESNQWCFIAEKIFLEQKNTMNYAIVLINIADNYCQLNQLDKAMEYSLKGEKLVLPTGSSYAMFGSRRVKANILEKQKNYNTAIAAYKSALSYALKEKATNDIAGLYKNLADVSLKNKQTLEAFDYLNLHMQYKDSVLNETSQKLLLDVEKKYETEKKDIEIKLLNQENDLTKSELVRKRIILYSALAGLLFLSGMIFLAVKSNIQKNKANVLLAEQKVIIEEKQKEILDSIHYAKRIQHALLAYKGSIKKYVKDHFIYFNPKDIVSGDFYWTATAYRDYAHENGMPLFFIGVCDSTGHGVPGAFMSILNTGFLNEAVNEKHILEPNKIFDHVRNRLINSISKEGQYDGFDGILLCIDADNKRITYAAANNAPLQMVNGKITIHPKNKMPVGQGVKVAPFDLFEISWDPDSILYLYTDGFADQFGGADGKKYKYKKLNEMLASISKGALNNQKLVLEETFNSWKGNLEQVDDVLIVGIRI